MAFLYVAEYKSLAVGDTDDPAQAPREPALAQYRIPIGPLASATPFVSGKGKAVLAMVHASAPCHIRFDGVPADATAMRLAANETRVYGVDLCEGISVVECVE